MSSKIANIAFLILALTVTSLAQSDPFGTPDTLKIGSIEIGPNAIASIPISLYNDENLIGIAIPLSFRGDSSAISIDSIVFNSSRTAECQFVDAYVDNNAKTLLIGIIPSLDTNQIFFNSGSSLLFSIFISTVGFQNDALCRIDSSELHPFNKLKLVGDSIIPFVPVFIPGAISLNHNLSITEDGQVSPSLGLCAYPNPSNSGLNLTIMLPHAGIIKLAVYNILGQEILNNSFTGAKGPNYLKVLNSLSWASGVYLIRADFDLQSNLTRILLLK